jgi:predicted RNase H-like nuclease (RuvC/YqgF family)
LARDAVLTRGTCPPAALQVSKKQLEVHRWEKDNVNSDKAVPSWVAGARNDIKTAKMNVQKNTRLIRELETRESDLVDECSMLREQVRRVPLKEERRMLLEQDFEVKELEIEKMQMRQLAKTHANQLQDRDLRVRKLVQQIEASNDVIRRQQNVLEENDIRSDELMQLAQLPFTPNGGERSELRLSGAGDRDRAGRGYSGREHSRGEHSRFPEIRTRCAPPH